MGAAMKSTIHHTDGTSDTLTYGDPFIRRRPPSREYGNDITCDCGVRKSTDHAACRRCTWLDGGTRNGECTLASAGSEFRVLGEVVTLDALAEATGCRRKANRYITALREAGRLREVIGGVDATDMDHYRRMKLDAQIRDSKNHNGDFHVYSLVTPVRSMVRR